MSQMYVAQNPTHLCAKHTFTEANGQLAAITSIKSRYVYATGAKLVPSIAQVGSGCQRGGLAHQASAVHTEGRLEVRGLREVVLEAALECIAVGVHEVPNHLLFADQPIPVRTQALCTAPRWS